MSRWQETHVLPLIGDVGVSREVHAVMLQAFEGHYRLAGKVFGRFEQEGHVNRSVGLARCEWQLGGHLLAVSVVHHSPSLTTPVSPNVR